PHALSSARRLPPATVAARHAAAAWWLMPCARAVSTPIDVKEGSVIRCHQMLLAALAVCAGLVLPVPAHAAPEVIASSQTPLKATMSSNGRFVVWQNVFYKATVVDRQTMTSVDYALDELRAGVPASHIDQLFGISDDGRFLTYSVSGGGTYGYTTAMRFDRTTGTHVVLF